MEIGTVEIIGIIGIVLLILIVNTYLFLARYGLFARVTVHEASVGPYVLVYKKHVGDYKQVAPVMDEMYHTLRDTFAIETTKGFGLYYDKPGEVPAAELRSAVGCIVEGRTADELAAMSLPYGVREYPASMSVVADFPYTGRLSIILGVLKVYPVFSKYIAGKNHPHTPVMELYDQPNRIIQYIASPQLPESVFDSFLA